MDAWSPSPTLRGNHTKSPDPGTGISILQPQQQDDPAPSNVAEPCATISPYPHSVRRFLQSSTHLTVPLLQIPLKLAAYLSHNVHSRSTGAPQGGDSSRIKKPYYVNAGARGSTVFLVIARSGHNLIPIGTFLRYNPRNRNDLFPSPPASRGIRVRRGSREAGTIGPLRGIGLWSLRK